VRPETWIAVPLALLLLLPAGAGAQVPGAASDLGDLPLDAFLDPSVEAASLHEELASTAAASVVVISGDEVRAQGARTLAEALRSVPGLFSYRDDFFPMLGVRGVGLPLDWSTRILFLVDGHPLNNAVALGQSYLDRDLPVSMLEVERIEVVKGPVGSVYGPTAFLGVVNVVTRGARGTRGGQLEAGLEAGLEAAQGRVTGGQGAALFSGQAGEILVAGSVSAAGSRGLTWTFPELQLDGSRPSPPGGRVSGGDGAASAAAHLRLDWRGLSLNAACSQSFHRMPTAPYSALLEDRGTWLQLTTCYLDASGQRALGPRLGLFWRVAYDQYRYQDRFAYAEPPVGSGAYRDRAFDHWGSAEVRATWRPIDGTFLMVGAAGQLHATLQQAYAPADPSLGSEPIRHGIVAGHLYLLAEQALPGHLRLHAGLTAAYNSIFGGRVSPKAALVWTPTAWDVVKAIGSTGFRPPTASEAFYLDNTDYLANPSLRPEITRSAELAWEHRFGRSGLLSATLFASHFADLIQYFAVPAPGLPGPPDPGTPSDWRQQAQNVASLTTWGAELSGALNLGRRLTVSAGLSAQRADRSDQFNFPSLTAGASAAIRTPWDPLQLVARGTMVSSRFKDAGNLGTRSRVPAATLLDLGANLEVPGVPGLVLQARVVNLLSAGAPDPVPSDFAPVSELPVAPRTFLLLVRWN
jgi:iron complex outermembrane receptor protein